MFIKNLKNEDYLILGINLEANEQIPLNDMGSASQIRNGSDTLIKAIDEDNIQVEYADGTVLTGTSKLVNLFSGGLTEIEISNASDIAVEIVNRSEDVRGYNNYYFLKDTITLKKNEYIDKFFRGRVKSLYILSDKSTIDVMITTGDGVELPADNVIKRQTLEFDFDGDLKDAKIRISAEGNTDIDIFIEGWNNDFSPEELQQFVNSWYKNEESWLTEQAVIVSYVNNTNDIVNPYIKDDTTLVIDDKKDKTDYDFYRIYKVTDKEFEIELLEANRWSYWNPNRYYVRVKNITHIEFQDETIDLNNVSLNSYLDHDSDKD